MYYPYDPSPTDSHALSLHDALPILSSGAHSRDPLARNDVERARATKQLRRRLRDLVFAGEQMNQSALDRDRKSTRLKYNHRCKSYAVSRLKKKNYHTTPLI